MTSWPSEVAQFQYPAWFERYEPLYQPADWRGLFARLIVNHLMWDLAYAREFVNLLPDALDETTQHASVVHARVHGDYRSDLLEEACFSAMLTTSESEHIVELLFYIEIEVAETMGFKPAIPFLSDVIEPAVNDIYSQVTYLLNPTFHDELTKKYQELLFPLRDHQNDLQAIWIDDADGLLDDISDLVLHEHPDDPPV